MEEDGEGDIWVAVRGAVGDYVEAEVGGTGTVCVRSGRHGVLGGGKMRSCPIEWCLDAPWMDAWF